MKGLISVFCVLFDGEVPLVVAGSVSFRLEDSDFVIISVGNEGMKRQNELKCRGDLTMCPDRLGLSFRETEFSSF